MWQVRNVMLCLSTFKHVLVVPPPTPGRMPPKQVVRREPADSATSGSDSFEHSQRPAREHGLPNEPRVVWGSDAYEPLPSVTPPKKQDGTKESR